MSAETCCEYACYEDPDCACDGCRKHHPGDCPATLAYGHDTHTPGCVEYSPWDPLPSPFSDLEAENALLRRAIEDFLLWWDMPPYVVDDDERLRVEVDALRASLDPSKVTSK